MSLDDYRDYTLVLSLEGGIVHASKEHGQGLRPLINCLEDWSGHGENATLYDKVVGLAAARLMVYSGLVAAVLTPIISEAAEDYLWANEVRVLARKTVPVILTADRSAVCPGEQLAEVCREPRVFLEEMLRRKGRPRRGGFPPADRPGCREICVYTAWCRACGAEAGGET